ncbi:MAG: hypothetical protein ABIE25_06835 [Thermoplasmatota archaeon]|nr:plasmid pRiA4b ORF-3 family protein [Candidatus Thermoplasmatota archaeon]MBU1913738.1 plasmid pRiA4b ORF-3 family protein [Candidatus Thermoplasmatota archaeon]
MARSTRRSTGRRAKGPRRLTVYSFKVSLHRRKDLYRTIAIGANNSLEDLHIAIQEAFDWDADHLYSFFLSGKLWDQDTEYTVLDDEFALDYDLPPSRDTRKARIRDLGLEVGAKFLYLFDYGDNHMFAVELIGRGKQVVKDELPTIIDQRGRSPEQYPDVPE